VARARSHRRRVLDLIENPDAKTTQAILDMAAEGVAVKDIARRTSLTTRTISRVLRAHGVESRRELPKEKHDRILELAKLPGVTLGAIARDVSVPERTIRKILRREGVELGLSASLAQRVEERIEERVEPTEPITRELRVEIAKDVVEFNWAIAASKMLLLPAQMLSQEDRLRRLQAELSKGEHAIRTAGGKKRGAMAGKVIIDDRDMISELQDVAAYVLKMIYGASPEEYQKRYKRGGVEAMLKYGKKVVAGQPTPVEGQAVADFISLAAAQSVAPGTGRAAGFQMLAEEYSEAQLAAARRGEARAEREWREEAKIVASLKRVSNDPEKFMARMEEVRAEVENLPGPVRKLAKRQIKKLGKSVVPPKLWESHWKLKEWERIQKLRDQARMLYEGKGQKPSEKDIDAVLRHMGEEHPRPAKPQPPRPAGLPPAWQEWLIRMREAAPGTRLPPEAFVAPEEPHPLGERAPRPKPPRKKRKPKPKTEKQIEREKKKKERERAKAAKERAVRTLAEREQRKRLESAIAAAELAARPAEPKKPKGKKPKLEAGLQPTLYGLLLAKATPEEIQEITGFAYVEDEIKAVRKRMRGRVAPAFQKEIKERLATHRRIKKIRREKEVAALLLAEATPEEVVTMVGVEYSPGDMAKIVREHGEGLPESFKAQTKQRLELARRLKEDVEQRAKQRAVELAARGNPGKRTTWADRLFYRVNAALVLNKPRTRRRRPATRRARNPNRGDALRKMMRL
jgi:hypothetical protein